MRKIVIGMAVLALLAGGQALAQRRNPPTAPAQPTPEELAKKREKETLDREYQNALRNTDQNTAPVRVDPWANMRGDDKKH